MAHLRTASMTVSLEKIIKVGSYWVAMISERKITAEHTNEAVFVSGYKQPLVILLRHGTAMAAFAPEGLPVTREELETLCPGAWDAAMKAE